MGRSTTSSTGSRPRARRELTPELERPIDVGRIVRVGLATFGVGAIAIATFIL